MSERSKPPTWLRLGYTLWFVAWVAAYWQLVGPVNFLWLCDIANFVILIAIWSGSSLLFSSQAVGVLIIQLVWVVDVLGRLLLGFHPVGGTEYMFDPAEPSLVRVLSTFHLWVPILLLWAVYRFGYDRQAWKLQSLIAWTVLPLSLLTDPELNLNWIWRPFGVEQTLVPPALYMVVCLFLYPLVLYWPTHKLLTIWLGRRGRVLPD